MDRRAFLKSAALAGTAASPAFLQNLAAAAQTGGAAPQSRSPETTGAPTSQSGPTMGERRGDMLYRTFGRTGERVSVIGLGGHHLGRLKEAADSIKLIRTAIDRGITFMDNCWDYHNGKSEEWMGDALKDGYRDKVFLMTKIDGRTKDAASKQIDESLMRLNTDRVDLMQFHEILRLEDPDRIFNEGGMEAMQAAQKAGKLRFIGFTGHKDPLAHLRMLEVAAQHKFRFDAAQMPLNVMDAHFRSFMQQVVPRLIVDGTAVLGMKSMADGFILQSNTVQPVECIHFALTLPVSVLIKGIESLERLDEALDAVRTFQPLGPEQMAALLERTAAVAMTGKYEPFKTATWFDGTAHHPEWLG